MSFSDKAKQVIGAVAPLLGTAIGGPFGALAGTFIGKALGVKPGDTSAIEAAVASGDPEVLVKLKQADNDFKTHMADVGLSESKLAYEDTANARAREIAVKDNTPRNLAYLILAFAGLCIAATLMGWTKVDSALAGTLIGYLVAESRSALAYYFGTSRSSKEKDETIADIAKS